MKKGKEREKREDSQLSVHTLGSSVTCSWEYNGGRVSMYTNCARIRPRRKKEEKTGKERGKGCDDVV